MKDVTMTDYPSSRPSSDKKAIKRSKKHHKAPVLRSSLKPGVVCIILAGKYRGKRCIFLKQLDDMILITGPFMLNGIPLRRISPAYVIACSGVKVDVSSIDLSKFTKEYFSRNSKSKKSTHKDVTEETFFGETETTKRDSSRISDQKEVDVPLVKLISKVPHMAKYLSSMFSLSKGDLPHLMNF